MTLTDQILIAVIPVIVFTVGTAIYLNRRKADKLYQRLFGLEDDPTDKGAIHELTDTIDNINKNVQDLNHRRIDDIEERLDELQESVASLDRRLSEEESPDDD